MACGGVGRSRGRTQTGAVRAAREVRQVREHMALRATHAEPCPPVPTELRAGDPHADDDNSRVE